MSIIEGRYYNGRQPVAVPARMEFAGREALLVTDHASERFAAAMLKVSPRIGKADRFIGLPNGGQFQCSDHDILGSLPQESRTEGPVAWLEDRWGVAAAGVFMVAFILLAGYFYGLPAAAKHIAARIPMETERSLGRDALTWLDKKEWFKPSNLDKDTQKSIRREFDRLRGGLPLKDCYVLEFRASKFIGANAFALPGGAIVITDDMVKAAESREEILAVLAHEIGHVELRHAMRSVLQNSAVAVVAAAITSDAASLSAAVAGFPALLAQMKYSREFESAADEYAFQLLKRNGYSPAAFASLMERLAKKHEQEEQAFAYVSSHPVTKDRVNRARAAAKE